MFPQQIYVGTLSFHLTQFITQFITQAIRRPGWDGDKNGERWDSAGGGGGHGLGRG